MKIKTMNQVIIKFKINSDLFLLNLCFTLTLLIFIPSNIYFYNTSEFNYYYYELFVAALIIVIIINIIIFPVLIFIKKQKSGIVSIIFALSVLIWIQGYLLNWNYGIEDGRITEISKLTKNITFDTSVWIIFIAAFYILRKKISKKLAVNYSIFMILIQLFSVIYMFYSYETRFSFKEYIVDNQKTFTFSKQENVILIMLDSFQSDIFKEIISEDKTYGELFGDFTYYPDTTGGYPYTESNVSLMMTGAYYKNNEAFENYKEKTFLNDSVPANLKKKGWNVFIYPLMGKSLYFDSNIIDNMLRKKYSIEVQSKFPIWNNSLVRCLPSYCAIQLKNYLPSSLFRNDTINWGFNLRKNIEKNIKIIQSNVFSFYHIPIPHWPLRINENLEYEPMEITRKNYKRQAKASLKYVAIMLDALKKKNIYDNAVIIIVGDHGALAQNQKFITMSSTGGTIELPWPAGQGIPLFLMKKINAKHNNIQISSDRMSLQYIKNIILYGNSPGERNKRYFYLTGPYKHGYYESMKEFFIEGNSWDVGSWVSTGTSYNKKTVAHVEPIEFNRDYLFNDSIMQYASLGWSGEGNGIGWTSGKTSIMLYPLKTPKKNIELVVEANPFLADCQIKNQIINLYVNNEFIEKWIMDQPWQTYRAEIPGKILIDNSLILKLEISNPASPAQYGMNNDNRMLGVAFRKIRFNVKNKMEMYSFGNELNMLDENSEIFMKDGWSFSEGTHRWSLGKRSSIKIPVMNYAGKLELKIDMMPLVFKGAKSQRVYVDINGYSRKYISLNTAGTYRIVFPYVKIKDNIMKINFEYPDAVSPAKLGLGNDERVLAVALKKLSVSN